MSGGWGWWKPEMPSALRVQLPNFPRTLGAWGQHLSDSEPHAPLSWEAWQDC